MVRLAVVQNEVKIDELQAMAGRGGYLHRNESCLQNFLRSKVREFRSLQRALSPEERERIAKLIRNAAG